MRAAPWVVGSILTLALPQAAFAHPHVFIDNRVTLLFAGGQMTGFRTEWRFDEIFTEDLVAQFDSDGDNQFSDAESKAVREGTLPNLTQFHYFTYVYENGKDIGKLEPADFKADVIDGAARFLFTYALPKPLDPHKTKIGVSIYDHEYFVEVLMAEKDPMAIEGDAGSGCETHIADDPKHAYFGGFVIPQTVSVQCK